MSLFAKRAESWATQSIQFLQDQDGPMERTIKGKLSEFFRDVVQVEEAFLVRVLYHNVQDVALCITGTPEMDAQLVLKGVQQVYTRAVNTDQALHTIFLAPEQRASISKVANAFYRSPVLK
jgi:hypothetical protein